MKITIVYDNTVFREDLRANWGFSALVEANQRKILFDTGGSGSILLSNIQKLEIDLKEVDDVFISHSHFDHTGGLSTFLDQNNKVKVWIPPSFRGVKNARKVIYVEKPTKLYEGIYSTGELEGKEQALCIKTKEGIVIIVGCSHPYMGHILDAAKQFGKIFGIIGGLHGFSDFELFQDLKLICPTHCTQYKAELKKLYAKQYINGGVGRIIEI